MAASSRASSSRVMSSSRCMNGMVEAASLIRNAGPRAQRCRFAAGDFRVAKRALSTRQFCASNCAISLPAQPKKNHRHKGSAALRASARKARDTVHALSCGMGSVLELTCSPKEISAKLIAAILGARPNSRECNLQTLSTNSRTSMTTCDHFDHRNQYKPKPQKRKSDFSHTFSAAQT